MKAVGLPEGCILSVRAGTTRRQAQAEPNFKLAFPKGAQHADPFKVDALLPVGNAVINDITIQSESLERVYNLDLGSSSGVNMHVSLMVRDLKSQPGALQGSPEAAGLTGLLEKPETAASSGRRQQAATSAKQYLDQHQLLQWAQVLFQNLIREQPEDPWAYIEKSRPVQKNGMAQGSQPDADGKSGDDKAKLAAQLADARQVQAAAEQAKAELSKELDIATREQADAKAEAKQSKEEISGLRAQLDAAKADASAIAKQAREEVSDLRAQLDAAEACLQATATEARPSGQLANLRREVRSRLALAESSGALAAAIAEDKPEAGRAVRMAMFKAANDGTLDAAVAQVEQSQHSHSKQSCQLAMQRRPAQAWRFLPSVGTFLGLPSVTRCAEMHPMQPLQNARNVSATEMKQKIRDVLVGASADGSLAGVLGASEQPATESQDPVQAKMRQQLRDVLVGATADGSLADALGAPEQPATELQDPVQAEVRQKVRDVLAGATADGSLADVLGVSEKPATESQDPVQAEMRQKVRDVLIGASADGSLADALSVPTQSVSEAEATVAELRHQVREVLVSASANGSLAKVVSSQEQVATEMVQAESRQKIREVLNSASLNGSLTEAISTVKNTSTETKPVKDEQPNSEQEWDLRIAVNNVDYSALLQRPQLLSDFETNTKNILAVEAGCGIQAKDVQLLLSAGSVVVQAAFQLPAGISRDSIRSKLASSASLQHEMISKLSSISGIQDVTTGPILVSKIQDKSKLSKEKWAHLPSVGTWGGICRRHQTAQAARNTPQQVEPSEQQRPFQWNLLPSVGTWAGKPQQKRAVQEKMEVPEQPHRLRQEIVPFVGTQPPRLRWEFLPSVGTWTGRPRQTWDVEDELKVPELPQWEILPSVGTWAGLQRVVRKNDAVQKEAKLPEQQRKVQWEFLPSVGTWAGLPRQKRIVQQEVEVSQLPRWAFLPSVGTWAGLQRVVRETCAVPKKTNVPEQPQQLRAVQEAEVPEHTRQLRWELLPSVGTWTGLPQPRWLVQKREEFASIEFAPEEVHAAKLRCRRALSIVLNNRIGEDIGEEQLHSPATSNEQWDLCLKVNNLDYQALSQRARLLADFEAVTKEVLAIEAGPGISADSIQLQLSAGSVVVQAAITPPEGVARTSIQSKLATSPSLQQALVSKVNSIEGIAEATTGPISVTNSDSLDSSLKLPPARTQDLSTAELPNVKAAPYSGSEEEDSEQEELLRLKALGALESGLLDGEDVDAEDADKESIRTKALDALELALHDSADESNPLPAELDMLKAKALRVLECVSKQRYEQLKEQAVAALETTLLSLETEEEEEEPPPLPTDMPAKMNASSLPQGDEVAVVKSAAPPAIQEDSFVSEDHLRELSEHARQAKEELREVKEAAQGAKDDIIALRTVARQEHESAKQQLAEEERLSRQRLEEFERQARQRLEETSRKVQEETTPHQATRGTTRSRPPSAAKEGPAGDLGLRALELKLRQRNDKLRRGNEALHQENARLRKLRECSEGASKLRASNEKTRKELRQQLGSRRRSVGRSEAGEVSSGKPGP